MGKQRGSTTVMALIAMLVLAIGSTTSIYVANRNAKNSVEYNDGLQAQYSAEAAVRTMYAAGKESLEPANGYVKGSKANDAIADWILAVKNKELSALEIKFPNSKMGQAVVQLATNAEDPAAYDVRAKATVKRASRLAYNNKVSMLAGKPPTPAVVGVNAGKLVASAQADENRHYSNKSYDWHVPDDYLTNPKAVVTSPAAGEKSAWNGLTSQLLFDDVLGVDFKPAAELKRVFRVNYFLKLTKVPNDASSGSGYGVYYLAKKSTPGKIENSASDPTAYVVQFDPGLHQGYESPAGGWAWGAAYLTGNAAPANWPYGAVIVKKVMADKTAGWQNEVWDENGTNDYRPHYAFQDNKELVQKFYDDTGALISPKVDPAQLKKNDVINIKTDDLATIALQPTIFDPDKSTKTPKVTRVPTVFGPEFTEKYRYRPPDLRIAYSLGDLAEGNVWQANTYYPVDAKVAVGVWVDESTTNRMVWKVTKAGISSKAKPSDLSSLPADGAVVNDGGVQWRAEAAPTAEDIANAVLTHSGLSIAKISMADLNYRVNAVNGTTEATEPYSIPFTMLKGSKNKISVELWADTNGNRIHLIHVNDVLVLAFNDRYDSAKKNIIDKDWELTPTADGYQRSTGLRIWNAAAEFYSTDSYGQGMATDVSAKYGIWGS